MSNRDAVIVDATRTAVGKRKGSLAGHHPVDLSAHLLRALAERNSFDPALVDDVIWGCVQQAGEQANNIGRNAVLAAGWPESVPATTVDRQCGSSQQAVHFAAAGLIAGHYDIAVAGGVEVMSRIPIGASLSNPELGSPDSPAINERYGQPFNQGVGAESMAAKWALSRHQLDDFASRSHAKLAAATDSGRLANQITPVSLANGSTFAVDEGLRRGTTPETLASLKPAFIEDGLIHAGNSSQISDGSAGLLMMTSEKANALGLRPLVRIHTAVVTGDDPVVMLTGPIPATAKALQKSGLSIEDIGVFEVNEAFAPVPMAWLAETGAAEERLNPNGGAIAIGHPLGGSGARLMCTMVHHMIDNGIQYGLQTMCEGGGMANATILELL